MTALVWDQSGERFYETGTRKGVLYPRDSSGNYSNGVAWNGLTAVSESPGGAEETALYADDGKYLSLYSAETFGATLEAYTYPDEWAECDGSKEIAPGVLAGQQARKGFGLCYRTVLGNDEQGEAYGYKLHIIYNAMASPSSKSYSTINDSPDAVTFSWEITTTPIIIGEGYKNSACLTIDSSKVSDSSVLTALEAILYGTADAQPRLPLPAEVIQIMNGASGATGNTGATANPDANGEG